MTSEDLSEIEARNETHRGLCERRADENNAEVDRERAFRVLSWQADTMVRDIDTLLAEVRANRCCVDPENITGPLGIYARCQRHGTGAKLRFTEGR